MAEQEEGGGPPPEGPQEPFIDKLVPDPAAPPDVVMLVGFLAKSSRAGHVRLYLREESGHPRANPQGRHASSVGGGEGREREFEWESRTARPAGEYPHYSGDVCHQYNFEGP